MTTTKTRIPGCGEYVYEAQDLVAAMREIAPIMDDRALLEDHMINRAGLWDGSETDLLVNYIEHALAARAWHLYTIRTKQ